MPCVLRHTGPEQLRSLGETPVITELAHQSLQSNAYAPVKGLIAKVDLRLGCDPAALRDIIERHRHVAGHLLKGIRDPAAREPRPEDLMIPGPGPSYLYGSENFRAGLRILGQLGLTYDAWHYHHQNADFLELVATVPDTVFVLNHFGTPLGVGLYNGARDAIFQQWRAHMQELAHHPNVYVKLGGLAMPDNGFNWHTGAQPPTSDELMGRQRKYYLHMIDCFGPQRCMFESNFPVDRLSLSYSVLWNAFKKMVADFSEAEKNALFHDTAARVYRLEVNQGVSSPG